MALTDTRRPAGPASATTRRGGRGGRRWRPEAAGWRQRLLAAAALAAAFAGLHVLLQGITWWLVGAGFALVVLAASAAARGMLRGVVWPALAAPVSGVLLLTVGFAADTALLGIVPTPATLGRIGALVEAGGTSIVEQRIPATPEPGIVLLLAVLMSACAWAVDLMLAGHRPALTALPLASILAIPLAIRSGLVDPLWFLVTAVLFLALLRIGRMRDSRPVVVVVGAVAALGALLVPSVLPPAPDAMRPSAGFRTGINPLITLGDDLRRGDPALALSYTTTSRDPVYLRLTTLDTFTGETWGPSVEARVAGADLAAFGPPPGLDDAVPRARVSADVTVSDIVSRWLPTPYPTTAIEGLVGDWFWEPEGLTVRTTQSGARGQQYTAAFLEVHPTEAQLAATGGDTSAAGSGTLQLPRDVPEIIAQTAHEVAGAAATPYEQAIALQSYLRGPGFSYSEKTPVEDGFDGTGMDALAVFLQRKVGYCVHYASAMAVMARELGIPSRIAVGFQPGERVLKDGSVQYLVSTNDLHAWPELYFEGVGWLRFEPTPGRGAVPRYGSELAGDPAAQPDGSSPEPTTAPTSTPQARPDRDQADPGSPEAVAAERGAASLLVVAVLAGLALLVLLPAAVRGAVRWRRLQRMRRGPDAAAAAWAEVRDTARDHGWSAPDSETARAFAERLAPELTGDGGAFAAFRGSVEASAYGRPDAVPPSPAELAAVRRAIARSTDARTRVRAFLLPPSLLRRWRPDEP